MDSNNNELLKLIDRLSIGNVCEQKIVAEKETKRIMQEKRLSGSLTYDNIKKLFFMTLHYKSNTAHLFIAAAASSNIKIKQLGYLGMQLEPNESQSFLLINTIKKDVVAKETRIMAMNFIANMCTRSSLFRDMLKKIDIQSNKTEFFQRELISHYALNTVDSRIRIVEITTQRLFVKLQILVDNIDTLLRDEFVCENDIKYLQSIAMRTKDINLIIKILQFLRLYTKNCEEADLKAFCKFVESKIAHGSIINRELLSIALSLEATEFLLSKSFDSVNAHGFIFKLVEAEEDYLNICAFRLIKQYKIHPKIAIYRIIEKGVKNAEHLDTLLDIIDDKNCAELYNEKARSIKIMHARHIRPDKINATWDKIVLRILRVCDDSLKVRILTENMQLHTMIELNSVLSEQCCARLFDHIKDIQAIEAFSFLYKLICLLKYSHLSHIYEKHLPRIIDQYSVNVKTYDTKLFTDFVDCIYNNESIYYTYSFLKRITNEVLRTHCDALIKIHEEYCSILQSLMVEKCVILESGDYLYYSFRTIDNIKKQVTLKYMNNYNIDFDGSNEFYVVERKDHVWNKAVIELYDFEAKTVSIKIDSSTSVPKKITLKLF